MLPAGGFRALDGDRGKADRIDDEESPLSHGSGMRPAGGRHATTREVVSIESVQARKYPRRRSRDVIIVTSHVFDIAHTAHGAIS